MSDNEPSSSISILVKCLIALAVFLAAIPIAFFTLYGIGQYHGTEFSPDDFTRREFSYNQTPWFKSILTKKTYDHSVGGFEQDLIADGWIQPTLNDPQVWHLVSDFGSTHNGLTSHDCDARFLTEYLDLTDEDGDYYWGVWNESYPKSAVQFWPWVADLARHEMYLKIPDLMQFAMKLESDNGSQFQDKLEKLVSQCYFEMGVLDLQLNRYPRAKTRLMRSIDIRPTPEARQQLAECLLKLDRENEKSRDQRVNNGAGS